MLGLVQYETGHYDDAVQSIRTAIALKPDFAPACVNLGLALHKLGKIDEALASYDRAKALQPDYAEAHYSRGNVLLDLKRLDVRSVELRSRDLARARPRAGALQPRHRAPRRRANRGRRGQLRSRAVDQSPLCEGAVQSRHCAAAHAPAGRGGGICSRGCSNWRRIFTFVPGMLLHAKMHCCDWAQFGPSVDALNGGVRARKMVAEPFGYQGLADSAEDLRTCAEVFTAERGPPAPAPMWNGEIYDNAKIRIGYVSGEFGYQATVRSDRRALRTARSQSVRAVRDRQRIGRHECDARQDRAGIR